MLQQPTWTLDGFLRMERQLDCLEHELSAPTCPLVHFLTSLIDESRVLMCVVAGVQVRFVVCRLECKLHVKSTDPEDQPRKNII